MRIDSSNKKHIFSWSIGITVFALIAFGFSNCSRAILGPSGLDASQSNAAQTVNVGSGTCATGQVAVGVDASNNALCATTITETGTLTCPTGDSIYQVLTTQTEVICVDNTSWDQTGSVCPVGEYLAAYSSSGAIQCLSPTSGSGTSTVTLTCPTGQYVSAVTNGQAVCTSLPTTVPSAIVCPAGQYLFNITGSTPDCRTPLWSSGSTASCPAGTYALGWLNSTLLCEQNTFSAGQTTQCPAGQVLLSYSSTGNATCSAPPNPDLSHACPAGTDVNGIANGKIVCQTAATGAPQCPAGQYVVGLNNGQVICSAVTSNNLPGACPVASYPIGISNGALVCSGFSQVLSVSNSRVCAPNTSQVCAISGGLGLQNCDSAGQTLSACLAVSCSSGYQLSNGQCNAVSCIAGSSQSCQMSNGAGTQYCGTAGTWGSCQISNCNAGYVMNNGQCVQAMCSPGSITACSVGNAYGFQSCNISGAGYGSCVITSCQNGYSLQGQACVDTTAPRITFTAKPANPTAGNSASIVYSAIDNESGIASVSCLLDNAPYNPCTSPVQLAGLANGNHSFEVTATDKNGNATNRTITWSNSVCQNGPYQQCSFGNGTGQMACMANGVYSPNCTLMACSAGYQLSNGSCVSLQCKPGFSVSGNQCVDNTAPVLMIGSQPADPTIGTTAVFQFAAADQGSGVAGFQCQLDSAAAQGCTSPLNLAGVSVGAHTMTITAIDIAGNKVSQALSWHEYVCSPGQVMSCGINNGQGAETCSATGSGYGSCSSVSCNNGYTMSNGQCADMTAPTLTISSAPAAASLTTTASFSFTASDAGSGIASITCSLDSAAAVACGSPASFANLRPGSHSVTIIATDRSGNVAKQIKTWVVQACSPGAVNSCGIANGVGQMTCSADGLTQNACSAISCNAGFTKNGAQCASIPTAPVFRFFNLISGEHFYTRIQAEGSAIPWYKYEGVGFSTYSQKVGAMHEIYRCYIAIGYHFISNDPGCEGQPNTTLDGSLGFVYDSNAAGLLPLDRYYAPYCTPAAGDHLETIHPESEYILVNGYYLEAPLGYVNAQ